MSTTGPRKSSSSSQLGTPNRTPAAARDILDTLSAVTRSSPRFADAYILDAVIARHVYAATRDGQVLERGYASVATARELLPTARTPPSAADSRYITAFVAAVTGTSNPSRTIVVASAAAAFPSRFPRASVATL